MHKLNPLALLILNFGYTLKIFFLSRGSELNGYLDLVAHYHSPINTLARRGPNSAQPVFLALAGCTQMACGCSEGRCLSKWAHLQ